MCNATLSTPTAAHDRPLRRHPDCREPTIPSIRPRCARPRHTGCARASAYRWRAFALFGDTQELVGSPTFRLPHRNTQRHLRRRQQPAAVERALAALCTCPAPNAADRPNVGNAHEHRGSNCTGTPIRAYPSDRSRETRPEAGRVRAPFVGRSFVDCHC